LFVHFLLAHIFGNRNHKRSMFSKHTFRSKEHKKYVMKTYFSVKEHTNYAFKPHLSVKKSQKVCFENILFGITKSVQRLLNVLRIRWHDCGVAGCASSPTSLRRLTRIHHSITTPAIMDQNQRLTPYARNWNRCSLWMTRCWWPLFSCQGRTCIMLLTHTYQMIVWFAKVL
jgi:hypothetical protein